MRKQPRLPEGDDGRQIADMSGVGGGLGLFLPRRPPAGHAPGPDQPQRPVRPWEPAPDTLTPEERHIYMLAAIKAALFLAGAYITGGAVCILAMIAFWS